jgi:hypothetical protein
VITTTGIPFFSISFPIVAPLPVPVSQVAVKITHVSRWFSMCQVDADFPRVEILAQFDSSAEGERLVRAD